MKKTTHNKEFEEGRECVIYILINDDTTDQIDDRYSP